jgi:hypothetical protein
MKMRILMAVSAIIAVVICVIFAKPMKKPLELQKPMEQHRKEYVSACTERVSKEQLRYRWSRITGNRWVWQSDVERKRRNIVRHEGVLIKLRILEERTFVVSNHPPAIVMDKVVTASRKTFPISTLVACGTKFFLLFTADFGDVVATTRTEGSNLFVVVAPPDQIPKWEELVMEVEAPSEDKKR